MLVINKVQLHNFLSYIDAELILDYDSPVLISGNTSTSTINSSNGSGKSSLFESIIYCLFGFTARGIKADSVVNRAINKDCSVHIYGNKGAIGFEIHRYRKDTKHGNSLYFIINDKDVTLSSTGATQDYIERFLNITYDTVLHTNYFSPNTSPSFAALTDAKQKDILKMVLNLNKWETANNSVSNRINEISEKIVKSESLLTTSISNYNNLFELHRQSLQSLNEFRKAKKHEHNSKKAKIAKVLKLQYKIKQDITTAINMRKPLLPEITTKIIQYTSNISQLKKEAQRYRKLFGGPVCPVCGSKVTLGTLRDKIAVLETEINNNIVILEKLQTNNIKIKTHNSQMSELDMKIHDLKKDLNTSEKLRIDISKTSTTQLDNHINILRETIIKYSIKLKNATNTIKSRTEEVRLFTTELALLKHVKKATSNTGIPAYIIKAFLNILNTKLKDYLKILTHNSMSGLIVFNDESNKLKLEITSGSKRAYNSFSTGESRRIDIAVLLSLINVSVMMNKGLNFIVLDEVFDGLDGAGVEAVISILHSLQQKNIFVISHNSDVKSYFSSTICIEKSDNCSKITTH